MKKVFSAILAVIMVLSCMVAVAIPTSAADEGDWTVWGPGDYDDDGNYEAEQTPIPGYEYTDDGFHIIQPDYTDCNPKFTIASKEKMDISQGFEMEVRIDKYAYGGEDGGNMDHWVSFALWDEPEVKHGVNDAGNGWFVLIRNHTTINEVCLVNPEKGFTFPNAPSVIAGTTFEEDVRDDGFVYLTFRVEVDNGEYHMFINDVEQTKTEQTEAMSELFANGLAYVSFTMQTAAAGTEMGCTITKVNGEIPQGTDSREPDKNTVVKAPIADASTVPENQPAIIFDGNLSSVRKLDDMPNLELEVNDDEKKTIHALTTASTIQVIFNVKSALSYDATDFPVFAVMFKDFCACSGATSLEDCTISEGFSAWYYAGEYTGASNDCVWEGCYFDDSVDVDGSNYKYAILDFSDMWEGRINGIRLDFGNIQSGTPGLNAFDICFLAFFRSTDEAEAYIGEYLGVEIEDETTEAPTTAVETEAPTTEATDEGTTVPSETNAETEAPEESGCKSVAGLGAISVMTIAAGAGVVVNRKKKKK